MERASQRFFSEAARGWTVVTERSTRGDEGGMGILATLGRRGTRLQVPARFEGVGERLVSGHDASSACAEVGRETARDGAALGEALDGLEATYACVRGGQPDFRAVRALCVAWSEETLRYLHQLSCEDPLTGLASLAHLRARLTEVSRCGDAGGASMTTSHALVAIDLPPGAWSGAGASHTRRREDAFEAKLRLAQVAECARVAFPGGETIAQAGSQRLLVLVRRQNGLAARVGLVRQLVSDGSADRGGEPARVWIEGLPASDVAVGRLLDELTRGSGSSAC